MVEAAAVDLKPTAAFDGVARVLTFADVHTRVLSVLHDGCDVFSVPNPEVFETTMRPKEDSGYRLFRGREKQWERSQHEDSLS